MTIAELAFDAQLSATELVRRCERRIGELVREGQQEGTILKRGQTRAKLDVGRDRHLGPTDAMGVDRSNFEAVTDTYTMADASAEQFEQAVAHTRIGLFEVSR